MSYKKILLLMYAMLALSPVFAHAEQYSEQPENWNVELKLLPLSDDFKHDMQHLVPKQSILMKAYVWYPSDQTWFVRYPDWDMPGASIEKFSTPVANTEREIDGLLQYGHTQNYILTPRDIGRLKLSQTSVDISVSQDGHSIVPIETPVEFNVDLPDGVYSLDDFLPAYSLEVEQLFNLYSNESDVRSLSIEEVEELTLKKGEMLERQIKLSAKGIKGGSIPELLPSGENLGTQKESRSEDIIGLYGFEGGKRIESLFYTPSDGGEILVEPLTIQWWHLTDQQLNEIELPGVSFSSVKVHAYEEAIQLSWWEKNGGVALGWLSYGIIALVAVLSAVVLFKSLIVRSFKRFKSMLERIRHSDRYMLFKLKWTLLFNSKAAANKQFSRYRYQLWPDDVPSELTNYLFSEYALGEQESMLKRSRQRFRLAFCLKLKSNKNVTKARPYQLPELSK